VTGEVFHQPKKESIMKIRTAALDIIGNDQGWKEVASNIFVNDIGEIFITSGEEALIISTTERTQAFTQET
jgi:hypothetical protein